MSDKMDFVDRTYIHRSMVEVLFLSIVDFSLGCVFEHIESLHRKFEMFLAVVEL